MHELVIRTKNAIVRFQDVDNTRLNTLSIIGSTNIAITDSSNNALMDLSQFMDIHVPLHCYANESFPNM